MADGLEDDVGPGDGWVKTRAFGKIAFVQRDGDYLLVALRVGNIPLGVPFVTSGAWGMVDVEVEFPHASEPATEVVKAD